MKLTDEQNKELDFWLEENMLVGDELTLDQIKLIRSMRSSERAWKEEAEQLQQRIKGIGVEEYLTLKYKYGELQNENARLRREIDRCESNSVERFIQRLRTMSGTGNGIGASTVARIHQFAIKEGFLSPTKST